MNRTFCMLIIIVVFNLMFSFLSGCGKAPNFITKHGINVYVGSMVTEEYTFNLRGNVGLITDSLISHLGRGHKAIDGLHLYFHMGRRTVNTVDDNGDDITRETNGFYLENNAHVTIDSFSCFALSATAHELMHHLEIVKEPNKGWLHENELYWGPSGIVSKVKQETRQVICGDQL